MKPIKTGDLIEVKLPWYKKLRAKLKGLVLPPQYGVVIRLPESSNDDAYVIEVDGGYFYSIAAEHVYPANERA